MYVNPASYYYSQLIEKGERIRPVSIYDEIPNPEAFLDGQSTVSGMQPLLSSEKEDHEVSILFLPMYGAVVLGGTIPNMRSIFNSMLKNT